MKKINEIFYSLQGEGCFTGVPAVFVRFAGCNLKCSFCDTDFISFTEMSDEQILEEIQKYPTEHVILTGGEPTLQLDKSLLDLLEAQKLTVHIETNGTHPLPEGKIDWVTCSPKYAPLHIQRIDELKVVYQGQDMEPYEGIQAQAYCLQPCDTGNAEKNRENVQQTIQYILQHPKWRLSLQTHKMIGIQ